MSKTDKNNPATNEVAGLQPTESTATPDVVQSTESTVTLGVIKPIENKENLLEIKFLLSPTGAFGLAYSVGEKAFFSELQAKELVESAYAEFV